MSPEKLRYYFYNTVFGVVALLALSVFGVLYLIWLAHSFAACVILGSIGLWCVGCMIFKPAPWKDKK